MQGCNAISSTTIFILSLIFAPICVVATALRFVATSRAGRKPDKEDWSAFLALLFFLAFVGLDLSAFCHLYTDPSQISGHKLITFYKIIYGIAPLPAFNQLFAKSSLLALYYRIYSVNRSYVIWIFSIFAVQAALTLTIALGLFLRCIPVEANWAAGYTDKYCIDQNVFIKVTEVLNSGIDFVMVILAIYMMRDLKMNFSTRWKLIVIFAIGGTSGIIGFIKIGQSEVYAIRQSYYQYQYGYWTIAQMATSIICCCAPVYKPIIPKWCLFARLKSRITGVSLRARHTSDADPEDASLRSHEWMRLEQRGQGGLTWAQQANATNFRSERPDGSTCDLKSVARSNARAIG